MSREKDEVKKDPGSVVSERDLMRKEVDLRRREVEEVEAKVGGLERRMARLGRNWGMLWSREMKWRSWRGRERRLSR